MRSYSYIFFPLLSILVSGRGTGMFKVQYKLLSWEKQKQFEMENSWEVMKPRRLKRKTIGRLGSPY